MTNVLRVPAAVRMGSQPACLPDGERQARLLLLAAMGTSAKTGRLRVTQVARNDASDTGAAEPVPKLPHERDQSTDQPAGRPARVMKRAHDDLNSGNRDTDERGVKAGRAFDQAFGSGKSTRQAVAPKRKRARP